MFMCTVLYKVYLIIIIIIVWVLFFIGQQKSKKKKEKNFQQVKHDFCTKPPQHTTCNLTFENKFYVLTGFVFCFFFLESMICVRVHVHFWW